MNRTKENDLYLIQHISTSIVACRVSIHTYTEIYENGPQHEHVKDLHNHVIGETEQKHEFRMAGLRVSEHHVPVSYHKI